ncbi:hypothetical protein CA13_25060 [Planctomycetes bacterium CA13]|uniref:Type II secretion system protein G n=1 Tax=Novipirellula herctigrandis TaxID=2527986 RepID=A0A5C5Z182_9BACT|nr:hypothetical protein CA13_25060 [Planctomycetes bacterium CA13]
MRPYDQHFCRQQSRQQTSNQMQRHAMTLLEVMLVLVISSIFAMIGIKHLMQSGQGSQRRSCELTCEMLQHYVETYIDDTGEMPTPSLREIATPQYTGGTLPTCPVTGTSYTFRGGQVICADHP